MRATVIGWLGGLLVACASAAHAEERSNAFNDPFVQLSDGLAGCPVPAGPLLSHDEALAESHGRAQRGVSCWLAGRCRLANSYLYDAEIIPRVIIAVHVDGRFTDTSVWALGQRRWVWLEGCVRSEEESRALENLVRSIDDVEAVINQLMVGSDGRPAYETRTP